MSLNKEWMFAYWKNGGKKKANWKYDMDGLSLSMHFRVSVYMCVN